MSTRKSTQAQLSRTIRLQHTIGRINAALLRAGSGTSLFEAVARIAEESGVFSALSIARPQGCARNSLCYCGKGTPGCFSAEFSQGLADCARQRGAEGIVVFADIAADSARHPWLAEVAAAGHASLASLPLCADDHSFGRLLALSSESDFFAADGLALLCQLAADIAYLLHRFEGGAMPTQECLAPARIQLDVLLDQLRTAREDERRLIGRELHDELGQALSALKMDVVGLERRLASNDQKCAAHLAHMRDLIADALEETHRIVGAKRPRVLEQRGLAAAIDWLAREFSERSGIPCHTTIDLGQREFADIVATTAFRCIQESLTNITRHAAASKVILTARQTGDALKLCVVDDGRGLAADFAERGRFGLAGLQQRAEALGGYMDIDSAPQQGTSIKISLPALPVASSAAILPLTWWPPAAAA